MGMIKLAEEKSKIRAMVDSLINGAIVWLQGELEEKPDQQPPLYTKEEKKELYSIKKDIEKYPKHSSD
jgi:hypothetical protein